MFLEKIIFIIITTLLLIIILVQYCVLIKKLSMPSFDTEQKLLINELPLLPPPSRPFSPIITNPDPVKMYDYHKLNDPLEEPTKRVDRYLLGPIEYRKMFNYPVRGDPDNPRWLGILINSDESESESANKIIKLFGRQKYPNSSHYEYYTTINMGFDQIKVHLRRRKELYDDDEVIVPELGKTYKVKLNKDDDNNYNPYF